MTAVLFHNQATIRVFWTSRRPNAELQAGQLVRIQWRCGDPVCVEGAIAVSRLVRLQQHVQAVDIFQTVPTTWVKDRDLLQRASTIWNSLHLSCQELITAVFWNEHRFERFCRCPSSCRGHHAETNGNLRHAVETAEAVQALLPRFKTANASLALTAALIHDAGKADEYVTAAGQTQLSDWGLLVSHQQTVTLWTGEVLGKLKNQLSREMQLSLIHAINASRAPREFGLRPPRTPEAALLSLADNASGRGDLITTQSSAEGGWGRQHSHLGNHAPYTLRQAAGVERSLL